MCGKGSNSTTEQSSQTTAPTPEVAQAYSNLLTQAQTTAATPFQSYGGPMVAGFNPTQQSAFGQINDLSQQYLPQALNYAQQGAGGINPGQISQYMSPFQQQVIQATQANIGENNALQQQQVMGNAISRGAWGGDRAGIAQSELARQQALASNQTMAGLNSANYQQALGAAQADRSAAAQGAYSMGNLQSSALQGIGAQMGAGNQQQQLSQSEMNVPYSKFLEQRGYPFQVAQWLAGLTTGVGSQMGGTSTGTKVTTPPPPNPLNTIAGLGMTAAGIFTGNPLLAMGGMSMGNPGGTGGGLGGLYAEGGAVMPYGEVGSLGIPGIALTRGPGPRPLQQQGGGGGAQQPAPSSNPGLERMTSSAIDLAGKMRGAIGSQPMSLAPPGQFFRRGGGIRGYDDGGMIPVLPTMGSGSIAPLSFQGQEDDAIEPVRGGIFGGMNFKPMGWPEADDSAAPAPMSFAGPDVRPAGEFNEIDAQAGMPPQQPGIALSFAGDQPSGFNPSGGIAPPGAPMQLPSADGAGSSQNGQGGLGGLLSALGLGNGLSDQARAGLMAAGLGMMASKSPFLGQAVGEGGLGGMRVYAEQKKAALAEKKQQEDLALRKELAKQGAERLAQHMQQFQKTHELDTKRFMETGRHNEAQETRGRHTYLGPSPDGQSSIFLDAISGETITRPIQVAPKPSGKDKVIPTSLQKDLGEKGAAASQLDTLVSSFKPEYGGWVSGTLGDLVNAAARNVPGMPQAQKEAAGFWQDYDRFKADVRHKLFGSALTASEIAAWNKFDANPGQAPDMIRRNIEHQQGILTQALSRRAESLAKQGYPREAIEAELGRSFKDMAAPAASSTPKVGDRKQFKQGAGVWDGKQWVPDTGGQP